MASTQSKIKQDTEWQIAKFDHLIGESEKLLAALRERRAKFDQVLADLNTVKDGPDPVTN
jgi:ABC-type transporter Mla subunit MlaD